MPFRVGQCQESGSKSFGLALHPLILFPEETGLAIQSICAFTLNWSWIAHPLRILIIRSFDAANPKCDKFLSAIFCALAYHSGSFKSFAMHTMALVGSNGSTVVRGHRSLEESCLSLATHGVPTPAQSMPKRPMLFTV